MRKVESGVKESVDFELAASAGETSAGKVPAGETSSSGYLLGDKPLIERSDKSVNTAAPG